MKLPKAILSQNSFLFLSRSWGLNSFMNELNNCGLPICKQSFYTYVRQHDGYMWKVSLLSRRILVFNFSCYSLQLILTNQNLLASTNTPHHILIKVHQCVYGTIFCPRHIKQLVYKITYLYTLFPQDSVAFKCF